jgi:Photosynthetic reaction centre cytochrome C subunit
MKRGRAAALASSSLLLLGTATFAISQDGVSDSTAPATEPSFPHGKPVNLKVLPKDISEVELGKQMKRFEADLGVTCSHCHVEDPGTRRFDYASDENPDKSTARLMLTMVQDINNKYLARLGGDRRYAVPVTCGSCHQGQSSPPPFESR